MHAKPAHILPPFSRTLLYIMPLSSLPCCLHVRDMPSCFQQSVRSPFTDSNASLRLSADCVCVEHLVTHLYECVYVVNFPSSSNSLALIMRVVVVLLLLRLFHGCCCSCLCFALICCPICFLYVSYFSQFCNFVPIFLVSLIPIIILL